METELERLVVRLMGDSSQYSGELSSMMTETESSLNRLGMKLNQLGSVGIKIGAVLTALFGGIALAGTMAAGKFEQTNIAFETMLGSAQETTKLLSDLTTFAAKTPFEMPEIEQAARGLALFGERGDELMESLNLLGNAAAGTSTDFGMIALIFNQIRGVGKLLTQDFRQLSTRGVLSLQDIADHFGVTTNAAQEMLSKGKITFEDVKDIFRSLSSEGGRFANLMERQSQSLLGLWSTLKDNFNILVRGIGQEIAPFAKVLVSNLNSLIETMADLSPTSRKVVAVLVGLGAAVGAVLTTVSGAALAFSPMIMAYSAWTAKQQAASVAAALLAASQKKAELATQANSQALLGGSAALERYNLDSVLATEQGTMIVASQSTVASQAGSTSQQVNQLATSTRLLGEASKQASTDIRLLGSRAGSTRGLLKSVDSTILIITQSTRRYSIVNDKLIGGLARLELANRALIQSTVKLALANRAVTQSQNERITSSQRLIGSNQTTALSTQVLSGRSTELANRSQILNAKVVSTNSTITRLGTTAAATSGSVYTMSRSLGNVSTTASASASSLSAATAQTGKLATGARLASGAMGGLITVMSSLFVITMSFQAGRFVGKWLAGLSSGATNAKDALSSLKEEIQSLENMSLDLTGVEVKDAAFALGSFNKQIEQTQDRINRLKEDQAWWKFWDESNQLIELEEQKLKGLQNQVQQLKSEFGEQLQPFIKEQDVAAARQRLDELKSLVGTMRSETTAGGMSTSFQVGINSDIVGLEDFKLVAHGFGVTMEDLAKSLGKSQQETQQKLEQFGVSITDVEQAITRAQQRANTFTVPPPDPKLIEEIQNLTTELEFQADTLGQNSRRVAIYKLQLAGVPDHYINAAYAAEEYLTKVEEQQQAQEEATQRQRQLEDGIDSLTRSLREQIATMGRTSNEIAVYRLQQEGATKSQLAEARALGAKLDALNAERKLMQEGAQLTERLASPRQKFIDQLVQTKKMLDAGAISQDTYQARLDELKDQFNKANQVATMELRIAGVDGVIKGSREAHKAYDEWMAKLNQPVENNSRDVEGAIQEAEQIASRGQQTVNANVGNSLQVTDAAVQPVNQLSEREITRVTESSERLVESVLRDTTFSDSSTTVDRTTQQFQDSLQQIKEHQTIVSEIGMMEGSNLSIALGPSPLTTPGVSESLKSAESSIVLGPSPLLRTDASVLPSEVSQGMFAVEDYLDRRTPQSITNQLFNADNYSSLTTPGVNVDKPVRTLSSSNIPTDIEAYLGDVSAGSLTNGIETENLSRTMMETNNLGDVLNRSENVFEYMRQSVDQSSSFTTGTALPQPEIATSIVVDEQRIQDKKDKEVEEQTKIQKRTLKATEELVRKKPVVLEGAGLNG